MAMLDECALRRQDFLPGSPIPLADGQQWMFPAPPTRLTPAGTAREAAGLGPDYVATVALVREAEDEVERLQAELALAICLLQRNYVLTPATLFALLGYSPGDLALTATQMELHRVALDHLRQAGAPANTMTPHDVRGQVIPAARQSEARRKRGFSVFRRLSWGRA
jgi:hypothetical protein